MTDQPKEVPEGYRVTDDSYGSWLCTEPGGWHHPDGFVCTNGPNGSNGSSGLDEHDKAVAACWEHKARADSVQRAIGAKNERERILKRVRGLRHGLQGFASKEYIYAGEMLEALAEGIEKGGE